MTKIFSYKAIVAGLLILGCSASYAQENRDVVHDARGNVVRNTFNNCVLTQWVGNSNECGEEKPEAVATIEEPKVFDLNSRESRTIYFQFDKSDILGDELAKLDSLADALKSADNLRGVRIVGYADRMGSDDYNEALSQRRAQEVEAHLREQGYLSTTVADTKWLGESEPITKCDEKLPRKEKIACLQKDRRVEVELDYIKKSR